MASRVRLSGNQTQRQFAAKTEEFVNNLAQTYQYDTQNISGSIDSFEQSIAALDAAITQLSSNVATLQTTVTSNSSSITSINSSITSINSQLATAQSNITSLTSQLSTLQSTVTANGTRLTTAESNIATLQPAVSTLQTNVTNITTRLTTAESNITALQTSVNTLQTSVNNIQSNLIGTWSTSYPGQTIAQKVAAIDTLDNTQNTRLTALESTSSSALLSGWTATYPGTSVTQKMTLVDGVNGVQTTRLDNYDNGTTATSQIRLANNTPFGSRIHCDGATNVSMYFDSTTRTGQLYKNGNDMVMRCNTGRMQLLSDTSSISLYGQRQPTGGVGALNTHGVYVTGLDNDATQNVQSLLSVVGNAASTTQLNVASGHLASSLGSGTYCTVNGVSTTGVSFAGGSNVYDPALNPTGTDHAIRCYSAANKTSLGKTASFEMSDIAGYSVLKTQAEFDAAKTATDPLISMSYLDYRLKTAYQYVYLEGKGNGCTPSSSGQGLSSRFLDGNWNVSKYISNPYGSLGTILFYDSTTGFIGVTAGKTYKITIMAYPQNSSPFYMRLRLYHVSQNQPLFGSTTPLQSDCFIVSVTNGVQEPCVNSYVAMYQAQTSHSIALTLQQIDTLSAANVNCIRWLVETYNHTY